MIKQFAPEYNLNEEGWTKELIYLAGIVDGEGSINILAKPKTRQIQLRLQVANTSDELMDWLFNNFGGKIYKHKMHSTYHKQRYDWIVTGKEAKKIIEGILPFLIIKRERATLALTFPILTPGLQHNDIIHEVMKELNK